MCSYDYSYDAQKLKLFPTTLKDASLCWFMGLGGNSIQNWEGMRQHSLKNIKIISKLGIYEEKSSR
jgi:hypothetical protein